MAAVDLELLRERARIIRDIRSFFTEREYLEHETPLLSPDLIPESCLEVFETKYVGPSTSTAPRVRQDPLWLIPSPEIWMKKIIARHRVNVFQICKCFRNGESTGFLHSPEFTMLEYYTMEADYMDSLRLTEELFSFLTEGSDGGPRPPFEKITMAEAFAHYAGFDLFAAAEIPGAMETEARRLGLNPPTNMGTAALYDLIFIHAVEPNLKHGRPVALLDYPAFVPCLAKRGKDGRTVERWELYHNGIELANCYSEETGAQRVKDFFESEAAEKQRRALVPHKVDTDYWKNFTGAGSTSFPSCSGVAMGVDRLIMALWGRSSIDGVLPFPL
jgi:lysyl-tRNA synthetase class 2